MSRNASPHDAAEESFAGLLEHMTRNSRAPISDPDLETRYTPRNGSSADSHPAARAVSGGAVQSSTIASNTLARPAARAMAPAAEVKPSLDGVPLSYENALRRHARYHSSTGSLELPVIEPAKSAAANTSTSVREAERKIRAAKNVRKAAAAETGSGAGEPGRRSPDIRNSVLPEVNGSGALPVAVKPKAMRSGIPAATNAARSNGRNSTGGRRRKRKQGGSQATQAAGASLARSGAPENTGKRSKASAISKSGISRSGISKPGPASTRPKTHLGSVLESRTGTRSDTVGASHRATARHLSESNSGNTLLATPEHHSESGLTRLESRTMQPVRSIEQERAMTLTRGMDLTAIEHKRSTVSVRLTDDEFLRLKERACESGISVSAYMRSCILDADQLRTQVKQALAEMRAMTARPDPAMFNALPSPERNVSVHSGDWFRVIVRSAAFLLSPLFPFRRSA